MSDQTPNAPVPADEGENTTVPQKKSLLGRLKARKEAFAADHPFACELGRQIGYGAAYMAGIIALAATYTAVTRGDNSEETPDELESAPEDDILSDEE